MATLRRSLIRLVDGLKWPGVVALALWLFHKPAADWGFTVLTSERIRIGETLRIVSWPLVAAAGLLIFRTPLSRFLEGLGQRVTKLSVFKVELELTAPEQQLRPLAGTVVDELKAVRAEDSGAGLLRMVEDLTAADYATIDLGRGQEWLTSRLFILAVMLQRMRATRCVAFVATVHDEPGRFVGVAGLPALRWSLAVAYPWLEATHAYAYAAVLAETYPTCAVSAPPPQAPPPGGPPQAPAPPAPPQPWYSAGALGPTGSASLVRSADGALDPQVASRLVRRYIRILETRAPAAPDDPTWTALSGGRVERASWVGPESLVGLLGARLQDSALSAAQAVSRSAAEDLMRQRDDFVAILGHRGRFKGLVDRHALLRQAASQAF